MKAKKTLVILLCIAMLLSCPQFAYAAEYAEDKGTGISLDDYIDYANRELTSLSLVPDVGLSLDDLFISQPFEVLNDNDDTNYVFFLFQFGRCIGELAVSHYDGSLFSSFLYEEISLVTSAYVNSTPVCFVSTGFSLLMCSEIGCEVIIGDFGYSDLLETAAVDEAASCAKKDVVSLTNVCPENLPSVITTPGSSKILPVPYVANDSVEVKVVVDGEEKIVNKGICWAASTASIIAYRDPTFDGVTAMDVYDTVKYHNGKGTGSQDDVLLALKSYGVAGYMGLYSSLPSSMVINQIDAGYPIYIAIKDVSPAPDNDEDWEPYHAVTICGYEYVNSMNDYYVIMDPNVRSKIYVSINRYTNVFTYTSSYGYVYTDWYRTVCHPM